MENPSKPKTPRVSSRSQGESAKEEESAAVAVFTICHIIAPSSAKAGLRPACHSKLTQRHWSRHMQTINAGAGGGAPQPPLRSPNCSCQGHSTLEIGNLLCGAGLEKKKGEEEKGWHLNLALPSAPNTATFISTIPGWWATHICYKVMISKTNPASKDQQEIPAKTARICALLFYLFYFF